MKKKIISTLLGASLLLTACSGSSDTASETPSSTKDINTIADLVHKAEDKTKIPEASKKRTDTFVAAISKPGGVFLPHFNQNGWDSNVYSVMFNSLVKLDETGKQIPSLAEKWDVSEDNLTYTFHLRKGLKFSDGSPLTADDVAFTITLLHDPAYAGFTDITRAYIKGRDEYKKGNATSLSGIKVINPETIEIQTEKVSVETLELIGGSVLSKAYYGKDYKKGNLEYLKALYAKPLGSGPYKLEEYVPGQEVRFVANEHYYEGKPKIERFIYKVTSSDTKLQLFQTGETDYDGFTANQENVEALKKLGFANVNMYTGNAFSYLDINHKRSYLKDKNVRQALIYGLNRQQLVDAVLQGYGTVANVPISPISWAYTNEVNQYEYDLEKAKSLLEEAGWKVGSDGIREKEGQKLKLTYLAPNSGGAVNDIFIPLAKENYKELGIELNPELLDFNAQLAKMKKGDYDLASVSTPMISDPNDTVASYLSDSPANDSGYANEKVDKLIEDSVSVLDVEKRKAIYKDLYKELNEDPHVILLYYRKILNAHNARIQGFEPSNFTGIVGSLPKLQIEQ
jgi:peptide/nickel transport system substrate-binding protein